MGDIGRQPVGVYPAWAVGPVSMGTHSVRRDA